MLFYHLLNQLLFINQLMNSLLLFHNFLLFFNPLILLISTKPFILPLYQIKMDHMFQIIFFLFHQIFILISNTYLFYAFLILLQMIYDHITSYDQFLLIIYLLSHYIYHLFFPYWFYTFLILITFLNMLFYNL